MNEQAVRPRKSLLQWAFPFRGYPRRKEIFGFCEGSLSTEVICCFDFVDRIRILVSGKVMVCTNTYTDTPVDMCYSESAVSVLPPFFHVKETQP